MKAKRISKVVSAVLVLSLILAACGGGGTTIPVPDTGPPPAAAADDAPAPAANDDIVEAATQAGGFVQDLEGREIRILCWWEYSMNSASPPPDEDADIIALLWYDNIRRIEAEYNVTIATPVIPFDDIMPQLTASVMAGDPVADIVMLTGTWTLTSLINNLILPASAYTTPDSYIWEPRFVRPVVEFEGEVWSFTRNEYDAGVGALGVNLDIINAIGAENPVDLYERGQWNWQTFREIMFLATRDTTGDGVIDQFGISGQPGDIAQQLIAANDGLMIRDRNYNFDDPRVMTALDFVYDIFVTDGVWHYDSTVGLDSGDWQRNFNSFREGQSVFWPFAVWAMGDEVSFDYAIVPWPVGPDNVTGATNSTGFGQANTIPVGVTNPQDVFMIYEQHLSWARDDIALMNDGMVDWVRSSMRHEDDVWRFLVDAWETQIFDLGNVVETYNWVLGGFVTQFWNGEMTVAQAVEHYRQPQQDLINETFR